MSVRSDLETRLKNWASSQSSPMKVAWEGETLHKTNR